MRIAAVAAGLIAASSSTAGAQDHELPRTVVVDAAACPELHLDRDELRRLVAVELAADGVRAVEATGPGARVSVLPVPCTAAAHRFDLAVDAGQQRGVRRVSVGQLEADGRVRTLALAIAESLRAHLTPVGPPPPPSGLPDVIREPEREPPDLAHLGWSLRPAARASTVVQTLWGGSAELDIPLLLEGRLRGIVGLFFALGASDSELGELHTVFAGGRVGVATVTSTVPLAFEAGLSMELGGVDLSASATAPGTLVTDRTGWAATGVATLGVRWWIDSTWFAGVRAEGGWVVRHFVGEEDGQAIGGVDGALIGVSLAVGSLL